MTKQTAIERWSSVKNQVCTATAHFRAVVTEACALYHAGCGQTVNSWLVAKRMFSDPTNGVPCWNLSYNNAQPSLSLDGVAFLPRTDQNFEAAKYLHWDGTATQWENIANEMAAATPESALAALRKEVEDQL